MMKTSSTPLKLIFATVFLDLLGFGIVLPWLPLVAHDMRASNAVIGLLLASYSAMQFLFAPLLGQWSDRIGRRPVLLVSLAGTCASFILLGMARSLAMLFAARIVDGISGGNISTAQAYIADVTPREERASGMALIGVAFGLGFVLGPALSGLLTPVSLRLFHNAFELPSFVAAALAATNVALTAIRLPESLPMEKRGRGAATRFGAADIPAVITQPRVSAGLLLFFLTNLAATTYQSAAPLWANRVLGLSISQVGWGFAYIGLLVAGVQGSIRRRLRKRGEARVLMGGLESWLLGFVLLALLTRWFPHWYWAMAIFVFMAYGQGSSNPALSGLISRRAGDEEQGRVLGVSQSMASLARIIGPLLGVSLAYNVLGPASPYWLGALLLAIGMPLVARILREEARPAGAETLSG